MRRARVSKSSGLCGRQTQKDRLASIVAADRSLHEVKAGGSQGLERVLNEFLHQGLDFGISDLGTGRVFAVVLTLEVVMAARKNRKEDLQTFFVYVIVPLFAAHSLSAIIIFFLCGSGHLHLSDRLLMTLLGSTFGEAAAVFAIVARYLFPSKTV
jgi:hypothetical protein